MSKFSSYFSLPLAWSYGESGVPSSGEVLMAREGSHSQGGMRGGER